MARSKRSTPKLTPSAPRVMEIIVTVRLPGDLAHRMDERRGEIERSTWIRDLIDSAVTSPAEASIREVEELMARRGVTVDMLKK